MEIDRKIYKRFLSLLVGLGLFMMGLTNVMIDLTSPRTLSDQEIIQKAKGLGLIEMKDAYKNSIDGGGSTPPATETPSNPKK